MKNLTTKEVVGLLTALLDDEEGVCEAGYEALRTLIDNHFEEPLPKELQEVLDAVDGCSGRYFLPENEEEGEEE